MRKRYRGCNQNDHYAEKLEFKCWKGSKMKREAGDLNGTEEE